MAEMSLGKLIRFSREAASLRQKDLAELLDVSSNYIYLLESDQREPSLSLLKEVSRHLHIPFGLLALESVRPWENASTEEESSRQLKIRELMTEVARLQQGALRDATSTP